MKASPRLQRSPETGGLMVWSRRELAQATNELGYDNNKTRQHGCRGWRPGNAVLLRRKRHNCRVNGVAKNNWHQRGQQSEHGPDRHSQSRTRISENRQEMVRLSSPNTVRISENGRKWGNGRTTARKKKHKQKKTPSGLDPDRTDTRCPLLTVGDPPRPGHLPSHHDARAFPCFALADPRHSRQRPPIEG